MSTLLGKLYRASTPDLVTIPNVEICSAGVAYELSTGTISFTPEELAAAVTAANDDVAVKNPRLKLGHIDPRFNGPEFDASPAFGKATNMRLGNNGMSIYGDYVGVPRWLADIMPTAYPSRSIEGGKQVETVTGKTHDMVITAVSLLGVQWPGCSVIEDLPQYYGAEMPESVQFVASATPIAASTDVDGIRRDFYKEWLPNQSNGSYWIRAIYVDPPEVIFEDDEEGTLHRLPYTAAEGSVSFGDPSQVEIAYNDVPQKVAASLVMNGMVAVAGDRIAASYNSRGDSVLASEGGRMDPKEIRTRLGLPEDATDDQVNARLDQLRALDANKVDGAAPFEGVSTGESAQTGGAIAQTQDPSNTLGDGKTPSMEGHDPAKADELGIGNDAVQASAAKDGTVVLDKTQYEELRAGASLAIKMHGDQIAASNNALLDDAVRQGKIPPARREHYLSLLTADPEGTTQILASLAPGLIPVDERGNGVTFEAGNGTDESAYPDSWFPELQRQETQGAPSSRVTVEAK